MRHCADRAIAVYEGLMEQRTRPKTGGFDAWRQAAARIATEWKLLSGGFRSLGNAAVDQLIDGERADDADTLR